MGDTLVITNVEKARADWPLQSGQDWEFIIDFLALDISAYIFSLVIRNNGVDFLTIPDARFTKPTNFQRSIIVTKTEIESLTIGKQYTYYIDVIVPITLLTKIWFYGNIITLPKDHD